MNTTDKTAIALQQLEDGLTELLKSGDWQRYLKVQSTFHHYSFNNVLLILFQCPEATRVAGYQAWKKLGRQVKKGEKSLKILAPITRKFVSETDNGEETRISVCGFQTASVFDISQTDGETLPEISSPLTGDDQGLLNSLVDFSLSHHVPIRFESILGGANGYCRFDRTTGQPLEIAVDSQLEPLQQAKTLAHEIAHSLLHTSTQYQQHLERSLAELEAESVAYVILH